MKTGESVRLKPCLPHLKRFLDNINLVPLDVELPDLEQDESLVDWRRERLHELLASPLRRLFHENYQREQFAVLCLFLYEACSQAFAEYVVGGELARSNSPFTVPPGASQEEETAIQALGEDWASWALPLMNETRMGMSAEQIECAIGRYNTFRFQHNFIKALVVYGASEGELFFRWHKNENNEIEVERPEYVKALWEVDLSNIRVCANKNCRRFFWAGRVDQKCCPKPDGKLHGCAHAYRNQQYRLNPEKTLQAKERRRQNREYKRKLATRQLPQSKLSKLRIAMSHGWQKREQISKASGLTLDETGNLIMNLIDANEAESRSTVDGHEFRLLERVKKGK